jgi:chromatin segregation and condensation protein Rec8/ScpA/Scc1 (kleisin family)
MKRGRVYVVQEDNFGEIRIEANDPSMWNDDVGDFMSEWSENSDMPEEEEGPDGTA